MVIIALRSNFMFNSEKYKNLTILKKNGITVKINLAICLRAFSASVMFSSLSFELMMITRSSYRYTNKKVRLGSVNGNNLKIHWSKTTHNGPYMPNAILEK